LLPSSHTLLINAVIGLCKNTNSWIHPLADLGYKVDVIEQSMRIDKSEKTIKPDIVVTSNKLIHSIVFECNGGTTIDRNQISRYNDLTNNDLSRWANTYTTEDYSHDICIMDFAENHDSISKQTANFPTLSLSNHYLKKHGKFSKTKLEEQFRKPTSIKKFKPPISYYPFSETEDRSVIMPYVLRAMISLFSTKSNDLDISNVEDLSQRILVRVHKLWNKLSKEHQRRLQTTITNLLRSRFNSCLAYWPIRHCCVYILIKMLWT